MGTCRWTSLDVHRCHVFPLPQRGNYWPLQIPREVLGFLNSELNKYPCWVLIPWKGLSRNLINWSCGGTGTKTPWDKWFRAFFKSNCSWAVVFWFESIKWCRGSFVAPFFCMPLKHIKPIGLGCLWPKERQTVTASPHSSQRRGTLTAKRTSGKT